MSSGLEKFTKKEIDTLYEALYNIYKSGYVSSELLSSLDSSINLNVEGGLIVAYKDRTPVGTPNLVQFISGIHNLNVKSDQNIFREAFVETLNSITTGNPKPICYKTGKASKLKISSDFSHSAIEVTQDKPDIKSWDQGRVIAEFIWLWLKVSTFKQFKKEKQLNIDTLFSPTPKPRLKSSSVKLLSDITDKDIGLALNIYLDTSTGSIVAKSGNEYKIPNLTDSQIASLKKVYYSCVNGKPINLETNLENKFLKPLDEIKNIRQVPLISYMHNLIGQIKVQKPTITSVNNLATPNQGDRALHPFDISCIVLHHTGGSANSAIYTFEESHDQDGDGDSDNPSSHFLVEKDGTIKQVVSELKKANHAGVSSFKGRSSVNDFSIGIEMANQGTGSDPFPPAQVTAVKDLCAWLCSNFLIPVENITGHKDIAQPAGRKSDPADNFNFTEFIGSVKQKLNINPFTILPKLSGEHAGFISADDSQKTLNSEVLNASGSFKLIEATVSGSTDSKVFVVNPKPPKKVKSHIVTERFKTQLGFDSLSDINSLKTELHDGFYYYNPQNDVNNLLKGTQIFEIDTRKIRVYPLINKNNGYYTAPSNESSIKKFKLNPNFYAMWNSLFFNIDKNSALEKEFKLSTNINVDLDNFIRLTYAYFNSYKEQNTINEAYFKKVLPKSYNKFSSITSNRSGVQISPSGLISFVKNSENLNLNEDYIFGLPVLYNTKTVSGEKVYFGSSEENYYTTFNDYLDSDDFKVRTNLFDGLQNLIDNSKSKRNPEFPDQSDYDPGSRVARYGFGIKDSNTLVFCLHAKLTSWPLAIDAYYHTGMTTVDMTRLLNILGCKTSFLLDSGRSACMYVKDSSGNILIHREAQRNNIPSYIALEKRT